MLENIIEIGYEDEENYISWLLNDPYIEKYKKELENNQIKERVDFMYVLIVDGVKKLESLNESVILKEAGKLASTYYKNGEIRNIKVCKVF